MTAKQLVVFKLLEQEYGVDIQRVVEIVNYTPIRPVPDVPQYVEGIINLRGSIYTIFNLRQKMHLADYESLDTTKIILMHIEGCQVGFIVDGVSEILAAEEEIIEDAPDILEKYDNKYIEGVISKDNRIIIAFNLDRLILEDELQL